MRNGRRYHIIYADPPWEYRVWSEKGKGRSVENHYRTLSMDDLKRLDVAVLAEMDSVLLMWATFPCLLQAFDLGEAWGFQYKTVAFVWVKLNKKDQQFFKGLGHYTRANAEVVLLFTRGKSLGRKSKGVGQIVVSKIGPHSQKPPEVRRRIVQLFGDLPRVELFARSRKGFFPDEEYEGWDVFGNEVNGSIKW